TGILRVRVAAANEHARGRLADVEALCEDARIGLRARFDRPIHKPKQGTERVGRRWIRRVGPHFAGFTVDILKRVTVEANYSSGEDYMVEFLGYRFAFNTDDFEQRVTAAAVRLGLDGGNDPGADGQ